MSAFAFLLAITLFFANATPPPATNLQVLCYHQISPDARDMMTTTPELFEEQLKYLRDNGYETVTVDEGTAFLKGKKPLAGKPVIITFDDGYDGVYTYGLPALKKHGMHAAVYLVVGKITERGTPHHLTWAQVKEMRQSGVFTIGSHTHSLHTKIPEDLDAGKITLMQIETDLKKSKDAIEKHIREPISSLAWPHGAYDGRTMKIALNLGFSTLFTTDYGPNHPGEGSARIRRIRLSSTNDTIPRLEEKLNQYR